MQNKMISTIKEIHNEAVCMFKAGGFYHVFGRDADIISYLFDYKIKDMNGNKECGFPINSVNKVTAKLQELKINYLLIDRRNNFDVDEKEEYKDLNRYMYYYKKANKYINIKRRIQNINCYLLENIDVLMNDSKLKEIEELIYD